MNASTSWRDIYQIMSGTEPFLPSGYQHLPTPLAVCSLYLWALLFCTSMHFLSQVVLPRSIVIYALDFFKTMAFCTYPFGHALMRKSYGPIGFYVGNVSINIVTANIMKKGAASPIGNFDNYLSKTVSLPVVCIRLLAQIAAGFAAFRLGLFLFHLDLHPLFTEKLMSIDCDTDLKVSVLFGFLFETVGVLYDCWLASQNLSRVGLLEQFIKFSNSAMLVNLGWSWTGAYLHPAMASGFTYGCKGTASLVHILVYWVGPFIGCYGALHLNQRFSLPTMKTKLKNGPVKNKAD
ncbi:hypothetical protein ScPMuIL_015297 [Solemya velum]